MKPGSLFGFYEPQQGKLVVKDFMQTNLNWLLSIICPQPQHCIHFGVNENSPSPINYNEFGTLRIEGKADESLSNVFIIDVKAITNDLLRTQADTNNPVEHAACLWAYIFMAIRCKLQMHHLSPEDFFGTALAQNNEQICANDIAFVQSITLEEFRNMISENNTFDIERISRALQAKATEYTGEHDPEFIIKEFNRQLALAEAANN